MSELVQRCVPLAWFYLTKTPLLKLHKPNSTLVSFCEQRLKPLPFIHSLFIIHNILCKIFISSSSSSENFRHQKCSKVQNLLTINYFSYIPRENQSEKQQSHQSGKSFRRSCNPSPKILLTPMDPKQEEENLTNERRVGRDQ